MNDDVFLRFMEIQNLKWDEEVKKFTDMCWESMVGMELKPPIIQDYFIVIVGDVHGKIPSYLRQTTPKNQSYRPNHKL